MSQPLFNAILNSLSTLFLIAGFIFIRQKNVPRHKFCMLSATATSTLFLVSYLIYHYQHGSTKFLGAGTIRSSYFAILISHTILAAVQVPLIYATLRFALRNEISKHKTLARVTWPIWFYVSITGVVVYIFLYQFPSQK